MKIRQIILAFKLLIGVSRKGKKIGDVSEKYFKKFSKIKDN